MKHTWSELVERAKRNDQDAFYDLYQNSYDPVYRTVKSMVRDDDAALDIVQDAFVKGFASLSTLEDTEQFLPWMKRIATNKARDWFKKKREVTFSQLADEEDHEPDFEDEREENLPEAVIDRNETARLIEEILRTLPDEQRMVIGMYYYQNMTIPEIARELEIGENTVKGRLHYAKKKIRASVEDLEKKGTKLYALSPIPFLLLLFRNQMLRPAVGNAPAATFGNIMASASGAAGATAAGTAAGAAAGSAAAGAATGAGGVLAGIGAKIASGMLALLIGGGIAAGVLAATLIGGGIKAAVDQANRGKDGISSVVSGADASGEGTSGEENSEEESSEEETSREDFTDASAEERLTRYLEEELIPEKGIYNIEQPAFYYQPKNHCTVKAVTYDPESERFPFVVSSLSGSAGDYEEYFQRSKANADVSGLYYAELADYDNDEETELFAVYVEQDELHLALFKVKDGRVSCVGEQVFPGVDVEYASRSITFVKNYGEEESYIVMHDEMIVDDVYIVDLYYRFNSKLEQVSYMMSDFENGVALRRYFDGREAETLDISTSELLKKAVAEYGGFEHNPRCTFYKLGAELNEFLREYYKGDSRPGTDPEPEPNPEGQEGLLKKYFEEVLLPEKGVYNLEQPSYKRDENGYIDRVTYAYNPAAGKFERDSSRTGPRDEGYEELLAAYKAAKEQTDISGVRFGTYFDSDGDGEQELLVIYGEDGQFYIELFDAEGGKVVSAAKTPLDVRDFGAEYHLRNVAYRFTSDGINFILEDLIRNQEDQQSPVGEIYYRLSGDLQLLSAMVIVGPDWLGSSLAAEIYTDGREEKMFYVNAFNYDSVVEGYTGSGDDRQPLYDFWEAGGFPSEDASPYIPMEDYFLQYYYG